MKILRTASLGPNFTGSYKKIVFYMTISADRDWYYKFV